MDTELQGKNKTIIFKGKLKLWKAQLINGVLTYFQHIQNCTDGTTGMSVHILYIDKLLKKSERWFENYEHMKFVVSFFTNSFTMAEHCRKMMFASAFWMVKITLFISCFISRLYGTKINKHVIAVQ